MVLEDDAAGCLLLLEEVQQLILVELVARVLFVPLSKTIVILEIRISN